MSKSKIDIAVTLYGFTEQWVNNPEFELEDMFKLLNRWGIKKFEVIAPQTFARYPLPSDEEIERLLELCGKYGVRPFSYGGYLDIGKITDHDLDDREVLHEIRCDLITARRLGCEYLRYTPLPLHLIGDVARLAETYGVKVAMEIHSPSKPSDPNVQAMMKEIQATGSSYIGLLPDFGCFIEKPNPLMIRRYLGMGAKKELLDFIVENRHNGYTEESMWDKIRQMGGGNVERLAISELFGFLSFAPKADLEGFASILPSCFYFHGKFFHIGEDLVETTIPYEELLRLAVEGGFQGTIMTEYEGHCFYLNDAEEQIERHLKMTRNILEKLGALA